jgi:sarcosine oxidase subunit gamma
MAEPRSPLARRAADLASLGAVEVPFLAQVNVRCGAEQAAALGLPMDADTVTGDRDRGALWLGPDEWLIVGAPGTEAAIVAEFDGALGGSHHSVVDVSSNRTVIELRGADRYRLLAGGCGLDLDPAGGWLPGRCAQTLYGRAQVILQEMDGRTRMFVRSSFAGYVVDRLLAPVGP